MVKALLGGNVMDNPFFKQCPSCKEWFSRRAILRDPKIKPIGMSVNPNDPDLSLFFFQHDCENCGTSFTIPVKEFLPVIEEPLDDNLQGRANCPGHCTHLDDLSDCHLPCLYAPFRRLILSIMREREQLSEKEAGAADQTVPAKETARPQATGLSMDLIR